MTAPDTGQNQSIDHLINLISDYTSHFQNGGVLTDQSAEFRAIRNNLETLSKELQEKSDYLKNNQKRIDQILEVLMQFTMSDLTQRAHISEAGDELDAIALGLNTLAEELEAVRNSEQKHIHELQEANKELKSFTYIASHDLQEPLRNIKLFINILLEKDKVRLSERGQQLLDKITLASTRMQKLIEDLLAFSRVQTYTDEFRVIDLNTVLHEIRMIYKDRAPKGQLTIKFSHLPAISGVPFQIHQLFENIIGNSIKYAKPGLSPVITISSEIVRGVELPIESIETGRFYHKIIIADNGIGFEQKYAHKIFDIFQRLHGKNEYSGTGIGLAICKKIAQNHAGFIYAVSEPDDGAAFHICLPVSNGILTEGVIIPQ